MPGPGDTQVIRTLLAHNVLCMAGNGNFIIEYSVHGGVRAFFHETLDSRGGMGPPVLYDPSKVK
jgi:hypothetical protein